MSITEFQNEVTTISVSGISTRSLFFHLKVDCGRGKEPNSTDDDCQDCPTGYYSDTEDSSACQECAAGSTTLGTGSETCG